MAQQTKEMTQGRPLQLIFLFSLPLMAGNLFQQLYTVMDSIIVGQCIGVQALAALGAADWIYWMFLWTIHGFTQGLSVPVAHAFGAGNQQLMRKTIAMLTVLCAICGAILTVAGVVSAKPLLLLLRTPSNILDSSWIYLTILLAGTPVVIAYNMATAVLRCLGNSRMPFFAMLIAAAVNIGLDLLFILEFHWGIAGAAIATVLAQLLAFVLCLLTLCRMPQVRLQRADWKPDNAILRHLCHLGLPIGFQNGIIAVGGMVVQRVLNQLGVLFVAGFTATNKLYGILESTAISFGYAMTTYMGQNYGAKQMKRVDQGIHAVLILSVIFSALISLTMLLFGQHILELFIDQNAEQRDAVVQIAVQYLRIMSSMLLFLYLVHAYRSSLQGLGDVQGPFISGAVELVMRIGAALLLPRLMGDSGIFYAEVAAWTGAALYLMFAFYRKIHWLKQRGAVIS